VKNAGRLWAQLKHLAVESVMLKMMDKEDQETLRRISETLDKILAVLSKPQNIIIRILVF